MIGATTHPSTPLKTPLATVAVSVVATGFSPEGLPPAGSGAPQWGHDGANVLTSCPHSRQGSRAIVACSHMGVRVVADTTL